MLRRHRPSPPSTTGLSLVESLWIVGLIALVIVMILGTRRAELERLRTELVQDQLTYLAGQCALALSHEPQTALPLLGPGEPPQGVPPGVGSLADLLPDGAHLPTDPWERAFVLLEEDGVCWLASGGPAGELPRPLARYAGARDYARPFTRPD